MITISSKAFESAAGGIAKVAINLFPPQIIPVLEVVGVGPQERSLIQRPITRAIKHQWRDAINPDLVGMNYIPPKKEKKKRGRHQPLA